MAPAAPRWHRLDHDDRRRQILAAARRLWCERHYAAVSLDDIASAAGVTRGLLHHYFGTKRDLYLAVVADLVRPSAAPVAPPAPGRPLARVVAESVERWLDLVERNRETWFASIGAEGFGRDPDLERILAEGRDRTVDLIISTLGLDGDGDGDGGGGGELRAVLRTYAGMAEAATREWLLVRSLSRAQTSTLLASTLLALVRDVAPAVAAAPAAPRLGERAGAPGARPRG